MKIAILSVVLATATVAHAETPPTFEILDRGDAVEVVAHGMKATRTAIAPIRSRLEIPIAGSPNAPRIFTKDATVKQIELDGGPTQRVVSVKLGVERPEGVQFARFAQAVQVGDDLHILVPRTLPADGQVAHLPEPTMPAIVAATTPAPPLVGPPAPPVAEKPVEAPKAIETPKAIEIPKAIEKPVETAKPIVAAAAVTTKDKPAPKLAPKADDKPIAKTKPADDGSSPFTMMVAGALCLVGGGLWLAKRKKAKVAPGQTIDVVAQRSLGGKARIVWLNAAGRDLVVAVTPQQVRMLHQSAPKRTEMPRSIGAKPREPEIEIPSFDHHMRDADMPVARTRTSSPAISGLLRLRERGDDIPSLRGRPSVSDEVATDDYAADEVWAREIRAATGGRR